MPTGKLSPEVITLLTPLIGMEESARYFYEAARTWARGQGYCGAERQFKCFVHYHKHDIKKVLGIFADWDTKPEYPGVPAPASFFVALPDVLDDALTVESDLLDQYNKITVELITLDLNIHHSVMKLRTRSQRFYMEMKEFVEKLKLFTVSNPLDLVYFDRKILRW